MLNLSAENKALCFEDSTLKPLCIFIYYFQEDDLHPYGGWWQYFTTIDDAIVLESAETTEGVLEGNSFELGSFCCPSVKVQWRNNGIRYKDMVAVPVQKIGNEYIAYFDGYISKEEISQDGQTVTAEISSFLTEKFNVSESTLKSLLDTLKAYNGSTFYDMLQNALSLVAGIVIEGIETSELTKRFANANTTITLNADTLPDTITVSELLKQAGEFLGAHIIVKEKRVVNIDDMINYQPSTMPIIDFIRFSNLNTVLQSQIKSLPSGYKRLPYIESNGTQYIDTNIFPDDTTKIQIKIAMNEYSGGVIVGYKNNESDSFRLFNYNGNTYLDYGSGEGYNRLIGDDTYDGRINKGIIYDLEVGNRYVKDLDTGRNKVQGSPVSFDEKTFSIQVFDNDTSSGKVFYCKIYKSNTIVADLVPCVRVTDNNVGMYDLVRNEFFANQGSGSFIAPNPIEIYTLPYYINSSVDKTNSLSIDKISVLTKTGDQLNYTQWLKDKAYNTYEIKDNIFFEALSAQSWEQCEKAVQEVGVYLDTLNLYYSDLQCIYPLFIEGGDYLIIKSKNQRLLPNEYLVLDNITLSNKNGTKFIDTYIHPNSDDIELNIEFALLGGSSSIFTADASGLGNDTLDLYADGNSLTSFIGYYGGSIQAVTFKIPYVPINQKINFNLKCGKQQYQYRGTFIGNGSYFGGNTIDTDNVSLNLGNVQDSEVNYKLYHFAYSQNGVKMCDMYPCMRKSDGVVGVYDIVQNIFEPIRGSATPEYEYETADIVVPVLSTTTRGIHSMRTNVLCKAVNSNNK